nr:hypothetical protein [cf. Phormidesmis sp. LEGE 11477]
MNGLADDIEIELSKLAKLEDQVQKIQQNIREAPVYRDSFYESLALKFHNFYTGCERIFCLIASDLNGGIPRDGSWHRRLLDRMAVARNQRRAVISSETASFLDEFLRFRHVVRNIYGFELKLDRLDELIAQYPTVWARFEAEVSDFVSWLRELAIALEE